MRKLIAALAASFMLLAGSPASAHLAGGDDIVVDGRILDFGYDPAPPVAGATTTFAFNLGDETTSKALAPESVWVRIAQGDAIAFAGTLAPANGSATVQAVLPSPGAYDVTARYSYGGRELDGTFQVTAAPAAASGTPEPHAPAPWSSTAALLALAAAGGIGYFAGLRGARKRI
ncbi:MAG TPA: hypothetical protein VL426_04190 [Candidatus Binatia bacterium]|jgi:hypothetical protein|nr:hypothetical protein [Candidatus Binatia bacterium]